MLFWRIETPGPAPEQNTRPGGCTAIGLRTSFTVAGARQLCSMTLLHLTEWVIRPAPLSEAALHAPPAAWQGMEVRSIDGYARQAALAARKSRRVSIASPAWGPRGGIDRGRGARLGVVDGR